MANSLPYLSSNKNVPDLFSKIASAKIPDAFTQKFLANVIGLKGTNDRPLISLLKQLGFLDDTGKPTSEYSKLKNPSLAKQSLATGIRRAYPALFEANESAHKLTGADLKGLISQVAGTDEGMTERIANTFTRLKDSADFSVPVGQAIVGEDVSDEEEEPDEEEQKPKGRRYQKEHVPPLGFHFNIEVHLPSNGTEETYLNIFNAIRKTFS